MTTAAAKIKGEEGTKVKLEILREDKSFEIEIVRKSIKTNHVEGEVLQKNICN